MYVDKAEAVRIKENIRGKDKEVKDILGQDRKGNVKERLNIGRTEKKTRNHRGTKMWTRQGYTIHPDWFIHIDKKEEDMREENKALKDKTEEYRIEKKQEIR